MLERLDEQGVESARRFGFAAAVQIAVQLDQLAALHRRETGLRTSGMLRLGAGAAIVRGLRRSRIVCTATLGGGCFAALVHALHVFRRRETRAGEETIAQRAERATNRRRF